MSSSPDPFSIAWRRGENGSQWFFKSPLYEVGRGFRGGDRMKTLSETQVKVRFTEEKLNSPLYNNSSSC